MPKCNSNSNDCMQFCNDCMYSSASNLVTGNSIDVSINSCDSEVRADMVVNEYNSVRVWGRIITCNGEPVENALVKLLKVICTGDKTCYQGIAHTLSDCEGFYQFEVCGNTDINNPACYKLLVSRAAIGPEKKIPLSENNCNPCNQCNPCNTSNNQCNPCNTSNSSNKCNEALDNPYPFNSNNDNSSMMTLPGEAGCMDPYCNDDPCIYNSYNQSGYKGKFKY